MEKSQDLENQMERAVLKEIDEIILHETQDRFCSCERFHRDVAALSLNQLPARYATSFRGSLITLEQIQEDENLQVELKRACLRALEIVAATPRCPEVDCPLKIRNLRAEISLELAPTESAS